MADKNKRAIVEEGAVPMFVQLLQSNDVKLQNEAVGALRNLSLDGTLLANAIPFSCQIDTRPSYLTSALHCPHFATFPNHFAPTLRIST